MVDFFKTFWLLHICVLILVNELNSLIIRPGKYTSSQDYRKDGHAKLSNNVTIDFTEKEMLQYKIWPRGIIPYFIDDFSFDKVLRDKIRYFLDQIGTETGLQFEEMQRPPDDDTFRCVFFVNRRGYLKCLDYSPDNFTNKGVQRVVLGYDCLMSGGPLSAIILTLVGVPPQHNAPNRDDYLKIHENNILPDKIHLFEAVKKEEWLFDNIVYDWASAGHYDFYKYTKNGGATIEPKVDVNSSSVVGEPEWLSQGDLLKIRYLYDNIKIKGKMNATKCMKLYKPGHNFDYFQPQPKPGEKREDSKSSFDKGNTYKNTGDAYNHDIIVKKKETTFKEKTKDYNIIKFSAKSPVDRIRWNFRLKKHRSVEKNKLYYNVKSKSDYNTDERK